MLGVVSQQQCTRAFTECWTCKSSSDHLATHLPHRHLTLDTLELWEPDAAPSWEHRQSHQSSRSVTTFKSSCASDSHILAFHHNGHLHNLIHEQYLVPQRSFGSPGWWALSLHNLDDLNGIPKPLMSSISLCITRETIDAVGCTTGVFTTLSNLNC